jgi:hypothetical protein
MKNLIPALGLAVLLAACSSDKPAQAASRDIALAPTPAPPADAQLHDVPEPAKSPAKPPARPAPAKRAVKPTIKPAPVAAAPPPVASPPVAVPVVAPPAAPVTPEFGVIAAGTDFAVRAPSKLCTNTLKVGDDVSATVAESVYGTFNVTVPAGASATLRVVEAQYGKNDVKAVKLRFALASVSVSGKTYDVTDADIIAPPITTVRRQTTGDQAKKVAAGAAIGAILGHVLGKNTKSTVVGAAAGAAGGAVVAAGTADYDGCVDANTRLAVKLTQPLRIRTGS